MTCAHYLSRRVLRDEFKEVWEDGIISRVVGFIESLVDCAVEAATTLVLYHEAIYVFHQVLHLSFHSTSIGDYN